MVYNTTAPTMLRKITVQDSESVYSLYIYATVLSIDDLDFLQYSSRTLPRPFVKSAGGVLRLRSEHGAVISSANGADRFTSLSRFSTAMWVRVTKPALSGWVSFIQNNSYLFKPFALNFEYATGCTLLDKSSEGNREYTIRFSDDLSTNTRTLRVLLGGLDGGFGVTLSIGEVSSEWWHIAVSYDGLTVNVYINGAIKTTGSWEGSIENLHNPLYLGRASSLNMWETRRNNNYDVEIDSFAFWNSSLPEDREPNWYFFSPDTFNRHLVAYFPFDEGDGITTLSSNGAITAELLPIYDIDSKIGAVDAWATSSAPIDDIVPTVEDLPVMIVLNASDPRKVLV